MGLRLRGGLHGKEGGFASGSEGGRAKGGRVAWILDCGKCGGISHQRAGDWVLGKITPAQGCFAKSDTAALCHFTPPPTAMPPAQGSFSKRDAAATFHFAA